MKPDASEEFESLIAGLLGPVHARSRRCQAMRQELLAHLDQAYREELSRGRDESAALEVARTRFGNVEGLRYQLQLSVPSLEKWFVSLFGSMEIAMSIGPRVAGWVMLVVGGAFMFGLAVVLPATAKLAEAVPSAGQSGRALDAALTLKYSLISLLLFSLLVTLAGAGVLVYAFVVRRKSIPG